MSFVQERKILLEMVTKAVKEISVDYGKLKYSEIKVNGKLLKDLMAIRVSPRKEMDGKFSCDAPVIWYYQFGRDKNVASVKNAAEMILDRIKVDERIVKSFVSMEISGVNIVFWLKEQRGKRKMEMHPDIDIIYEDDGIVVVNKPYNVLSIPGIENKHCMQGLLDQVYGQVRVVHRLDFETSGVLVFALTKAVAQSLNEQFRKRLITKKYMAICHGKIQEEHGTIDKPIIANSETRLMQMVCVESGKPSKTHYSVVEQDDVACRVQLQPVSGRTHQLRVHMDAIGHNILGDSLYGSKNCYKMANRLMLHAWNITFKHPYTNKMVTFEAPFQFGLKDVVCIDRIK